MTGMHTTEKMNSWELISKPLVYLRKLLTAQNYLFLRSRWHQKSNGNEQDGTPFYSIMDFVQDVQYQQFPDKRIVIRGGFLSGSSIRSIVLY